MNMQSCTFQFILKPFHDCIHRIENLNKYIYIYIKKEEKKAKETEAK